MEDPVKIPGSRAQRAVRTRRRMIEVAAELFASAGYASTTMERIADRATVAVQTVYYTFGTKGRLLCEAMEFAAAGDHDPAPMHRRPWMVQAMSTVSAARSLALAVEHGSDVYQRAAPLWPAIQAAAVTDTSVQSYWDAVTEARRTGMRRLVDHVAALSGLRPGLDAERAADVLFVIDSHATFHGLVGVAGWSPVAFKAWLYATLVEQLLPAGSATADAVDGLSFSGTVTPGYAP